MRSPAGDHQAPVERPNSSCATNSAVPHVIVPLPSVVICASRPSASDTANRFWSRTKLIRRPSSAMLRSISEASLLVSRRVLRSEEHTSELQSLMRISYAVFCLKKKTAHYRQSCTPSSPIVKTTLQDGVQLDSTP